MTGYSVGCHGLACAGGAIEEQTQSLWYPTCVQTQVLASLNDNKSVVFGSKRKLRTLNALLHIHV